MFDASTSSAPGYLLIFEFAFDGVGEVFEENLSGVIIGCALFDVEFGITLLIRKGWKCLALVQLGLEFGNGFFLGVQ